MINKLTGEPVSSEMQSVLKRLAASESVPEAEITKLKEIREANSCISSGAQTIMLKDRDGIRQGVFNRLQNMGSAVTKENGAVSFSGEIRCEKRLDIVIGLPASGKSSALVEPISEMYKSRVIDSDEAKKLLPEYNDGWGAGIVHKESQVISDKQLFSALNKGENITYPRVGGDCVELQKIIAAAKQKGYSVYVHFNKLDRNKALGRMISRFLETGRYIKPELISKYGSAISDTYEHLKKMPALVNGFSKWSNDVPLGRRPKLIEYSRSCEDMVKAFKPTIPDSLQQAEANCKLLRGKIDEVNAVFRQNPELSKAYVKKRDELRAQKGLTNNHAKPKPPKR
jgi:predicted ABC-type ATPase